MVEQVRRIGLTPAEMVKLSTAKNYSDQLVSTELTAMGRMAGGSKPGSAAHVAAIELLHNAAYHEAKARVMQPLAELNEMLRSRAQSRVDAAVQISFYLRLGLIAMAVIEMACLWWVYRSLNRILGSSLRELHDYIVRLGADPLATPPQAPPYKDSIVDWLAQMQVRLNVLHHRHEQNEEILRQRTEELEARNQELRRLNRKDALTGLQNRLSADERLVQEFNRFKRNADPAQGYAVLFADIDHFKHVNDTYGHDIGDRVLCQLGLVLEASLRQTDYLARFGGEEFLILLPDTEIEGATTLAEKIRVAVMAHSFPVDGQLTISIGVTLVNVQDSSDSDALHRADVALYRAKNGGRNRVEVVLA